jgi:hypothetical protein
MSAKARTVVESLLAEGPQTATAVGRDGESITATVGKMIGFKADIEQYAPVKEIRYGGWNGRIPQVKVDIKEGEYAKDNVWIDLKDCFL